MEMEMGASETGSSVSNYHEAYPIINYITTGPMETGHAQMVPFSGRGPQLSVMCDILVYRVVAVHLGFEEGKVEWHGLKSFFNGIEIRDRVVPRRVMTNK
jgi:hypothetical protein